MIPRRLVDWRALLLAAAAVCAAPAQASLPALHDLATTRPAPATALQTELPRELPGPCEGEQCGDLEVAQPKTRVRGFELDLYCRLGGEDGLSCRPRRVWLEEYGEGASDRLVYAKARYFDPQLGRFLSQDSYLGELTEPPSLHRYLYAFDNPIRYYDPTGNETEYTQLSRMDAEIKRQEKERDWCSSNPDACAAKAAAAAEADRVALVRTLGMVQALGGVAQVGLGAAALGAPEPTGATKVAGWVAVVRGFDNTLTGVRQVFSGQVEEPVTQTAVRKGLEEAGTSPETARTASEWTGVVADAASTAQVSKAVTPVVARMPLKTSGDIPPRPANSTRYEATFEAKLKPGEHYPGASAARHFQEANRQLYEAMKADPEFAAAMEARYPGITEGVAPGRRGAFPRTPPTSDTTWHHHPTREGALELVPYEQHTAPGPVQESLHPNQKGGMENWGGGRKPRVKDEP